MNNSDFRSLATPRRDVVPNTAGKDQITFSKLSKEQKSDSMRHAIKKQDNSMKAKKGNQKKKNLRNESREYIEQQEISFGPNYRDRAKERREGTEALTVEDFWISKGKEDESNVLDSSVGIIEKNALLQQIDQSRYKIESKEEENIKEAKGQREEIGKKVLRTIRSSRSPTIAPVSSIFLPRTSSLIFNLEFIKGKVAPTRLLRSKDECRSEYEETFLPSRSIQSIVTSAMQSIQEARQQAKLEMEKKLEQKIDNVIDVMEEDSDDDIFPDAGNYIPVKSGIIPEIQEKETHKTANKSYFVKTSAPISVKEVELPAELSDKQKSMLQDLSSIDYNNAKVPIEKEDFYTECYEEAKGAEYTHYAFAEQNSDEEEVLGQGDRPIGGEPEPKRQKTN